MTKAYCIRTVTLPTEEEKLQDKLQRWLSRDPLRCRYEDCDHPVATEEERITCPKCRENLALTEIQQHWPLSYKLKAFTLGVIEFRQDWTTHFDPPLIEWYDWGREIAHRITFRRFET